MGRATPQLLGEAGFRGILAEGEAQGLAHRVLGLEEKQPAVPHRKTLREFPRGLCWMPADLLTPGCADTQAPRDAEQPYVS